MHKIFRHSKRKSYIFVFWNPDHPHFKRQQMALESRFNVSTFQYIISYKETRFEATENLIVLSFAISKNCKILLTYQNVFLFYQNKDMIDTFCGYECFSKNLDMALENCRRNHKLPQKLCKIVRKSQLKW